MDGYRIESGYVATGIREFEANSYPLRHRTTLMEGAYGAQVGESSETANRCGFCGYGLPENTVVSDPDSSYEFCSERCHSAFESGERPFVGSRAHKRRSTGISALDTLLPWGMPANSFVLLSGESGIRHRELQTELIWRTLTGGEPAVIVSLVDPPVAIVEEFLELGWNVLPYLESERLRIVDCFTSRLRKEHQTPVRATEWSEHLRSRIEPVVTRVDDTTDMRAIENRLLEATDAVDMNGIGVVVIDSLNELETQGQRHRARQFLQEVRAEICKRLFVPIFASMTTSVEESYTREHSYFFDGIVDMRRNEDLVPNRRLKQLSIRKMDGVSYLPDWVAYENFGDGFVIFDPGQTDSVYLSPSPGPT